MIHDREHRAVCESERPLDPSAAVLAPMEGPPIRSFVYGSFSSDVPALGKSRGT